MYSVISNNLSLKYQRVTPSGCKDIGIRTYKFVTKTQFLYLFSQGQLPIFLDQITYFPRANAYFVFLKSYKTFVFTCR